MNIEYGTGKTIIQEIGYDTIQIAKLRIENQAIGLATALSDVPFRSMPFDGIIGLGFPDDMAPPGSKTLLNNLKDQKVLQNNVFSVYFSDSLAAPGEITFGGWEAKRVLPGLKMLWFPLDRTERSVFWEIILKDVKINGQSTGYCAKIKEAGMKCRAAIDTASTFIMTPSDLYNTIIRQMDVMPDCSNNDSLPDLSFSFLDVGGETYDFALGGSSDMISENFYQSSSSTNVAPSANASASPHLSNASFRAPTATRRCTLAVTPLDIPPPEEPVVVIGLTFLRKYLSVYDYDNMRVGLTRANHN